MRDFQSCFGENAVQIADSSSSNGIKTAQNLVTCVYQCRFKGRSCHITITWSKNLMGQGFSVEIDNSSNQCLCKVDIKPWLFSKRKGSKSLDVESSNIDIYWDFCSAKFGVGPEPLDGFYLAIVCDKHMILLLGDMRKEAFKKTSASSVPITSSFIVKKEHVYGKNCFYTRAKFRDNGPIHDLMIECDTSSTNDICLIVRVDTKNLMQVKRVQWKFRGNHTIMVDGFPIEVFWDVYSWLFGTSPGSAVFMFRTSVSMEKLWNNQPLGDPAVLQWTHSQRYCDSQSRQFGFSLILYAWKQE
ncbi:hypothetical protein RND81_04G024600 [Saponaria officinalis]|uniref:DUF868 domain-containing protein n=1 Tax=Saponaria officinalis TaxID=3572 RepID=A0AAW1LG67_SAPOF